jgi:ribonuclease P protein component
VASKKGVDKRAVRRNRAKRRLRALVSVLLKRDWMFLPKDLELEWLLLAHRSSLVCSSKELETEVLAHWERIKASLVRHNAMKEGIDERI